ncbi:MAG: DNA-binding response regulator [Gemmatimonadetes bacterium]|nr:MAG: DNA-binding response regulator [Gemmatimonadota bacterium]
MIRVVIADDHPVVQAGLRQIAAAQPDMHVVGEAADGDRLLTVLAGTPADVLLLDLTMPGAPFPDLLKHVLARYPTLRVLVMSMHPEDQFAGRALREGAAGYLTKERTPQDLVEAIRKVVRGGTYVSPTLAEHLAASLDGRRPAVAHEALSDREHEVLRLIGAGKTVGEIATLLALSPKTVSTYRTRILHKLGLRTSAELIRYALRHQLTT